jgi:hypothetical protein
MEYSWTCSVNGGLARSIRHRRPISTMGELAFRSLGLKHLRPSIGAHDAYWTSGSSSKELTVATRLHVWAIYSRAHLEQIQLIPERLAVSILGTP